MLLVTASKTRAFSLVEMLSVIAVIGVIAAITVPNISRINDAASDAKDRRNAQNLASIIASAQAAGLDFVAEGDGELSDVIAAASDGDIVASGVFQGAYFGLSLSAEEQAVASAYLVLGNGGVMYIGKGGEVPEFDPVSPGQAEEDPDDLPDNSPDGGK